MELIQHPSIVFVLHQSGPDPAVHFTVSPVHSRHLPGVVQGVPAADAKKHAVYHPGHVNFVSPILGLDDDRLHHELARQIDQPHGQYRLKHPTLLQKQHCDKQPAASHP
eukprot:3038809-Rhodomonas_salina.1